MPLTALVASLRRRRGGPASSAGGPVVGGPVVGGPVIGGPAADLVGVDPQGGPVHASVADRAMTLLFLTSTCVGCRPIWRSLRDEPNLVVVVTPDPSTESRRGVAAIAPPGVVTVMSSAGWHDYGVTGAPWRVEVRDGVVVAHGPATEGFAGQTAEGRDVGPTA